MSNKRLTILGIITVVMIAWAIVQAQFSGQSNSIRAAVPVYLIQGLDTELVDTIIFKSQTKSFTLKRSEKGFSVVDKDNYPALIGEVNNLITTCLDIHIADIYTDNPSNHKDLEVTEDTARFVVKFLKSDSNMIAGLVIGKDKEQGQGIFVRLLSNDKVFVTFDKVLLKDDATQYIEKKLFSVDDDQVESVTVVLPDESYVLKKDKDSGNIVMHDLPTGKKLKSSDVENLFYSLDKLRFTDVKKKTSENTKLNFDKKFVCKLNNSTVYTVMFAKDNDKFFITCQAEFGDKSPVMKGDEVESEEELKKKEAKLLANEGVDKFDKKHSQWIYEITEYNSGNLIKPLSDLLEDEVIEEVIEVIEEEVIEDKVIEDEVIDEKITDESSANDVEVLDNTANIEINAAD